jgi:hypothetical protein
MNTGGTTPRCSRIFKAMAGLLHTEKKERNKKTGALVA